MADKPKLDIFRTLAAIDRNDKNFYRNLTEEEQKGFTPVVVMRWLSAVSDKSGLSEYYTVMTNDVVNTGFWDLAKHPHLQYLLMTLVGSGKSQKHEWIPMAKKEKKWKLQELFRRRYPGASDDEVDILLTVSSEEDIAQLARDYGQEDKEVDTLVKEFRLIKKPLK